jgi:hypothetical protein
MALDLQIYICISWQWRSDYWVIKDFTAADGKTVLNIHRTYTVILKEWMVHFLKFTSSFKVFYFN